MTQLCAQLQHLAPFDLCALTTYAITSTQTPQKGYFCEPMQDCDLALIHFLYTNNEEYVI